MMERQKNEQSSYKMVFFVVTQLLIIRTTNSSSMLGFPIEYARQFKYSLYGSLLQKSYTRANKKRKKYSTVEKTT